GAARLLPPDPTRRPSDLDGEEGRRRASTPTRSDEDADHEAGTPQRQDRRGVAGQPATVEIRDPGNRLFTDQRSEAVEPDEEREDLVVVPGHEQSDGEQERGSVGGSHAGRGHPHYGKARAEQEGNDKEREPASGQAQPGV